MITVILGLEFLICHIRLAFKGCMENVMLQRLSQILSASDDNKRSLLRSDTKYTDSAVESLGTAYLSCWQCA